eukprot:1145619-Pelagomonas_calceolata.AAC.1
MPHSRRMPQDGVVDLTSRRFRKTFRIHLCNWLIPVPCRVYKSGYRHHLLQLSCPCRQHIALGHHALIIAPCNARQWHESKNGEQSRQGPHCCLYLTGTARLNRCFR